MRCPHAETLLDAGCLTHASLQFKEAFTAQGIDGGKKAAYALRAAILEQCGSHAGEIEVVAKVYANLAGLCKAMRRDGSLASESDLKDFSLGFTQAKASFDFVDVGHGKERADNKIKGACPGYGSQSLRLPVLTQMPPETTKWHLRNSNCKQVILGISHDAGYAPFLDELFQDGSLRIRATVLEGIPTVRELTATGVNILNLNDRLFRSEKLIDRIHAEPHVPPVSFEVKAATAASVISVGSISTPATSAASTPAQAPAATYARAVKISTPPPQAAPPTQPKQAPPPAARPAQSKPAAW